MGSGAGSHALAALYPAARGRRRRHRATMVELARERYRAPNLSFVAGTSRSRCFRRARSTAIFDSSVLHHVTSFGGYRHETPPTRWPRRSPSSKSTACSSCATSSTRARTSCSSTSRPTTATTADDPRRCSTAALFERFAREFRSLAPSARFPVERLDGDGGAAAAARGLAPLPPLAQARRRVPASQGLPRRLGERGEGGVHVLHARPVRGAVRAARPARARVDAPPQPVDRSPPLRRPLSSARRGGRAAGRARDQLHHRRREGAGRPMASPSAERAPRPRPASCGSSIIATARRARCSTSPRDPSRRSTSFRTSISAAARIALRRA